VPEPIRDRPDVLVLGVGGTLGEAWMRGLLSGLESAGGIDFRECEYFVGSSAGSIVAATLAAGRRPNAGDRAAREWGEAAPGEAAEPGRLGRALRGAGRFGVAAASPFAPVALAGVAPAGRALRAAALAAAPSTRPARRRTRSPAALPARRTSRGGPSGGPRRRRAGARRSGRPASRGGG